MKYINIRIKDGRIDGRIGLPLKTRLVIEWDGGVNSGEAHVYETIKEWDEDTEEYCYPTKRRTARPSEL